MSTSSRIELMLRALALRVRPWVAVHDHPHAGPDSIIGVARDDLGELSHQPVYAACDVSRCGDASRAR